VISVCAGFSNRPEIIEINMNIAKYQQACRQYEGFISQSPIR
jgi:hypothetical protein